MLQLLTVHTKHYRLAFYAFCQGCTKRKRAACKFLWSLFDQTCHLNILNLYHNQWHQPFSIVLFSVFEPCTPVGIGCRCFLPGQCSPTCFPFLPSIPCPLMWELSAIISLSHTWRVENKAVKGEVLLLLWLVWVWCGTIFSIRNPCGSINIWRIKYYPIYLFIPCVRQWIPRWYIVNNRNNPLFAFMTVFG